MVYHFEVGLIMRDTMLISKMIYSSKIWYNITKQQYSKLEEIDEMFMRKLLDLPSSAPRISLYNECGKTQIKYLIKIRRLMYYWHVLHLDSSELVHKFYSAQKLKPVRNDFVLQIEQDKSDLGLRNMSDEDIYKIPKEKFKSCILAKIDQLKCKKYQEAKGTKTMDLEPRSSSTPVNYLLSKHLCVKEIQTLFKLKTQMINVKHNFKSSNTNNMWCRTCSLFSETQEHLYYCSEIRKHLPNIDFTKFNYKMLKGSLAEQEKFAKIYQLILERSYDTFNHGLKDLCTFVMQQMLLISGRIFINK